LKDTDIDNPSSEYHYALLYASGQVAVENDLVDEKFNVGTADTVKLKRTIEMYQWVEEKETKSVSSDEEVTKYTYTKKFVAHKVDSNAFK